MAGDADADLLEWPRGWTIVRNAESGSALQVLRDVEGCGARW